MGTLSGFTNLPSSTSSFNSSAEDASNSKEEQPQIKNLILQAWRERWSDVKWGIQSKSVFNTSPGDTSMADSILQEALNGPGPNNMVLSYLMHSIFSKVISVPALMRSISQYDGYHKPFCVMSLVEVLEKIKDYDTFTETNGSCLEIGKSITAVVHWLLACMYSSLENLSDSSDGSPETEHTKIVKRCGTLIRSWVVDPYLNSLMKLAVLDDLTLLDNLRRMSKEISKFQDSQHRDDIIAVTLVMEGFDKLTPSSITQDLPHMEHVDSHQNVNPCIQTVIINAALRDLSSQISVVGFEIIAIKRIKGISTKNAFYNIIHSAITGLTDAVGSNHELRFTGFVFFKLPELLCIVRDNITDGDELFEGLELFLENESALDILDSKLNCNTLELLVTSFQKVGVLSEANKMALMNRKVNSANSTKVNSSNVVILLKAEATLLSILKTLDGHGDYGKNQDSILGVLSDMMGKSFQLILTAAAATGRLSLLVAKLIKLNQCSRQVIGEAGKQSTTRASLFDISFLMLCTIVQQYGTKVIDSGDSECFFEDWCRECMIQADMARDPSAILGRCDQAKVDVLLSQYLQSDNELKTSLIFWHEVCYNSAGLMNQLLLGWEADTVSLTDVKRVMDSLRSKTCCLPICMATWLCANIQIMPQPRCTKASQLVDHLLSPVKFDETQDKFLERHSMMTDVINNMLDCVRTRVDETNFKQEDCVSKTMTNSELFKQSWLRLRTKSNADLKTIYNLKHLLQINGPAHFVSSSINELIQLQHTMELQHWCEILHGIFHIDLFKCTEALLASLVPTCIILAARDPNFVEPQILALVTLTVDAILSCYYKLKTESKIVYCGDDEPKRKRQRLISTSTNEPVQKEGVGNDKIIEFNKVLGSMYNDFSTALNRSSQMGPHVAFVVTFFEELLHKVDLDDVNAILSLPPLHLMQQLMSLKSRLQPEKILAMVDIKSPIGREKCARLICALKRSKDGQ